MTRLHTTDDLSSVSMTRLYIELTEQRNSGRLLLSDYIASANALESVVNADGSTTIYLEVHRRERFSILPRSRRRPWVIRLFARRVSGPRIDPLGEAANVRKVPRRREERL